MSSTSSEECEHGLSREASRKRFFIDDESKRRFDPREQYANIDLHSFTFGVARSIFNDVPDDCAAIHVNVPLVFPAPDQLQDMDEFEQAAVASLAHWEEKGSGYFKQQSTRRQTLGSGLAGRPGRLDP